MQIKIFLVITFKIKIFLVSCISNNWNQVRFKNLIFNILVNVSNNKAAKEITIRY